MLLANVPYVPDDDLKTLKKRELSSISCVVYHTTGTGLWRRWFRDNPAYAQGTPYPEPTGYLEAHKSLEGLPTYSPAPLGWSEWKKRRGSEPYPFDTALRVYCGGLHKYGPHFLVCGETGRLVQLVPLDRRAQHVGAYTAKEYRSENEQQKWQGYLQAQSPRHPLPLPPRTARTPTVNERSIGIEVAPPRSGANTQWSEATLTTLQTLHKQCETLLGCSLDYYSHSEVHPLDRMTKTGYPTDPPGSQWDQRVWDSLDQR